MLSKNREPELFTIDGDCIQFNSNLTLKTIDGSHQTIKRILKNLTSEKVTLDLSQVVKMDSAGVVLIDEIRRNLSENQIAAELSGASPHIKQVLKTFSLPRAEIEEIERTGLFERLGRGAYHLKNETITDYLYIMADLAYWTFLGIFNRKSQRKGEFVNQSINIGVNALPLVGLISFLIGLVLALQSAAQLRQFGANIFIVDLVVIAMTAEMGPLLTAIMIAGRSGSAIASELASMKVAEELDALQTMALNPLRYLVVPKMLASIFTMPFLTLLADILGILGGMVVAYFYLDISPVSFYYRMADSLMFKDIITGIIKSLVFAGLIVQTSTFFGLSVRGGAVGVGKYTTKAVVISIFLVILSDSIMGLIFY
ncbi:MAG: MlaE family lipid ABC transporter permease subunit [Calditrichae bacterium]|nr:MlaE family lipid ABC transporter permease subunit [Calditrichota bacterium]MCB9059294.1 MlaE family lipid ABC transporter permease subunit [Calditrichia bacterium]